MWAGPPRRLAAAAALLLAVLTPVARALFEDEVGQYEWFLKQIGQPTSFAYSADASDRIFVASASGAVASVLLKDGTVQWRRVAATQGGVQLLRPSSRGLLSVTDGGFVQAWKGSTGDLTWQRRYPDEVLDLLFVGSGAREVVILVRESEVEARTMAGKHEWSTSSTLAGPKARYWGAAKCEGDAGVSALAAAADGTGATVLRLEAATGKVLKKVPLPGSVGKGLASGSYMVADAHLVFLAGDKLHTHFICGEGKGDSDSFDLNKVKSKGGPFRLMPWQRTPGVFAVTNGATTAIFGLGPKGLKHLRTFEGVAVVGPVFSVHDDETGQPVAVAVVKEEGTQIQLLDPASGNVQPAIRAPGYAVGDHGPARLLLVHELSSGEHRTVISAADHSLAGIQGTKVQWVREEALASIHQAVFYSRSALATSAARAAREASDDSAASGLPALTAQLSELPGRIGELVQSPMKVVTAFVDLVTPKRSRDAGAMKLMPDAKPPTSSDELRDFGADKLIITMSRAWKVFAIEATTSEIVWQKYLGAPDVVPADDAGRVSNGTGPWMQLLPSSAAPYSELLIVAPTPAPPGGAKKPAVLFWLEPLVGSVLHQENFQQGADVVSIMPLPRRGLQPVLPFILVDSARNVHAMPSAQAEATKLLDENTDRLFHYEVDMAAQAVQGYGVEKGAGGKVLASLWNLELGSVGERILASAAPEHREWDHVPVHIKGDATILYKYINPNMLAVVSEDVRGNTSSLNLYALDAVTGHVLHQSHIPGGAPPVNLVVCDNWVIMHYRNPKRARFEIIVMEFFQAKADDGPWDILFGGRHANMTKSAHHLETPVPLQQTYIFPSGVTAMGVTATLKGITPRSVIMALSTEHVFRVSKDMLNPRRPYVSPTGEKEKALFPAQFAPTKEEALPPYSPSLPMRPTEVLTYYHPMGQVSGIISSPTALESTSLIFCYGLDLFFTPVQTAKAYDVLSPGFNYALLYASVGLVLIFFVITSFWAQHRYLQERWK